MAKHTSSPKTYFYVLVALLMLLALTVLTSEIEHGILSVATAMSIATAKGLLILLFFMHLSISSGLVRLFAAAGFLWLSILIGLTLNDYLTRGWTG